MQTEPVTPDAHVAGTTLEEAQQRMEHCRTDFRQYRAKRETVEKSMDAAQAAADAAAAKWRGLLRTNDGTLTPEIQRLRKEAQRAGELRNEYESIHAEMTMGFEVRKLALEDAAAEYLSAFRRAQKAGLDAGLAKVVASAGPMLQQVRALFHKLERSDKTSPTWTDDEAVIDERFTHRLVKCIGPLESSAPGLGPPDPDLSDVDMSFATSPAKRTILRSKLQQQQAAQDHHGPSMTA